jgi:hypothetical protein
MQVEASEQLLQFEEQLEHLDWFKNYPIGQPGLQLAPVRMLPSLHEVH